MTYKILPHLDHIDYLEVATYRKNQDENEPLDSVTVECTKCGEVVEEIYNASEDNTPPLDVEFPPSDKPTWEDGVKDAARIVQNEMCNKKALDHPNTRVHPAVFETIKELELRLAAMLSRGSYESCDVLMQLYGADCVQRSTRDLMQRASEHLVIDTHDSLPLMNLRWEDNELQFARLLCEIIAALDEGQTKDLIIDLCRSMDLGPEDVNALFDRAEKAWEAAKEKVK